MKKYIITILFALLSLSLFGQTKQDTLYYSNGVVKEIRSFDGGRLHGECIVYDQKGDTLAIAHYFRGKKHGVWKIWRGDNTLAYEFQYDMGIKVGTWKYYDESGSLLGAREY